MKRPLMLAVAFAGLFAFTVETKAAEPKKSQVPQSILASLGLGGMQAMSDKDGMQVRGKASLGNGNSAVNLVLPPFPSPAFALDTPAGGPLVLIPTTGTDGLFTAAFGP